MVGYEPWRMAGGTISLGRVCPNAGRPAILATFSVML